MQHTESIRPSLARGLSLSLAATLCIGVTLAGCSEEAPKIVAKPKIVAPPPPPAPTVTTIADLMLQLGIDERINLAEEDAPPTTAERIAVLRFYHAMITGDIQGFNAMLSRTDSEELAQIASNGEYAEAIAEIGAVDLKTARTPSGDPAVVSVIQSISSFQPQLWRYTVDGSGSGIFTSAPTPFDVLDHIHGSGGDWVAQWYALLDSEAALALALDEEIETEQTDRTTDLDSSGSTGGSSPGGAPSVPRSPSEEPPVEPPSFDPTGPR